jgi:hypothetical protein
VRGILFVLLGGGLLWLVVANFGRTEAKTHGDGSLEGASLEEGMPEDGRFMERPRPQTTPAGSGEIPGQKPGGDPQGPSGEGTDGFSPGDAGDPADPGEPLTRPAARNSPDSGSVAPHQRPDVNVILGLQREDALASLLLHDVSALTAYLNGEGRELLQSRKDLAIAYALAVLGRVDQARTRRDKVKDSPEVNGAERALLDLLIAGGSVRTPQATQAGWTEGGPLMKAAAMAALAEEGRALLQNGEWAAAARVFSDLLLEELDAPWPSGRETLREWSASLHRAQKRHRWAKDGNWPAIEVEVKSGDNLTYIRKRLVRENPGLVLCTGLIDRANELGGRYLRLDETLRVPTDRPSTLVDLEAHWLLYLLGDEVVAAWEVGIGKPGHETRPGTYRVKDKIPEPPHFRPGEPPVPYGHENNPLGTRWIGWAESGGLGFHGTRNAAGVGGDVSEGCIRMRNEEIEVLFEIVPVGSSIVVQE